MRRPITAERGRGGWHERVAGIARKLGWHVWHDRSRGVNDADEPDLRLLRERLVMVELKGTGKRLERGQRDRLIAYARAGIEVYAWWPEDEDEVIEMLTRRGNEQVPSMAIMHLLTLPVVGDGRIKRAATHREGE